MNIISIMVRGTLEFVIVSVIAIPIAGDPLALHGILYLYFWPSFCD